MTTKSEALPAVLPPSLCSPLQARCLEILAKENGSLHTQRVANRAGVTRIAAVSALRALERKGLAGSYPGHDRWAGQQWYTTRMANKQISNSCKEHEK